MIIYLCNTKKYKERMIDMNTRVELKFKAKEQIKGNIAMLFLCLLVINAITVALNFIPIAGQIASVLITPVLSYGLVKVYYGLSKGEPVRVEKIFDGFSNFSNIFLANFLVGLFTILWSILLVVPGIIKAYSYSMVNYILCDNPEMSAMDAIKESQRIMQGHKMDLFVLQLSFILWMLMGIVTLGIGYIYVIPYMQQTLVNFYNSIKEPQEEKIQYNL